MSGLYISRHAVIIMLMIAAFLRVVLTVHTLPAQPGMAAFWLASPVSGGSVDSTCLRNSWTSPASLLRHSRHPRRMGTLWSSQPSGPQVISASEALLMQRLSLLPTFQT